MPEPRPQRLAEGLCSCDGWHQDRRLKIDDRVSEAVREQEEEFEKHAEFAVSLRGLLVRHDLCEPLDPNSKRNIILVVALLVLALVLYFACMLPGMITDSKYDSIQPGMTEADVIGILGESEVVAAGGALGGGRGLNAARPAMKSVKWVRGKATIVVLFSGGTVTQKTRSDQS